MLAMKNALQERVSLKPFTTLKVGGEAQYFVTVSSEESLIEAVSFADEHGLQVHILGGGSNTLVSDEGVTGLVIHMDMRGISHELQGDSVIIRAKAGEVLDDVVALTVENGWWGLENLSHIPGSIGATPVQNVGAYGVETKDVVLEVRAYDRERKEFVTLAPSACAFGYRDSIFKHEAGKKFIIVEVSFLLSIVPQPHIAYRDLASQFENRVPTQKEIREALVKIRGSKFPDWKRVGTAGSFFKNPIVTQEIFQALAVRYPDMPSYNAEGNVKLPLGWILDKVVGVRGYSEGHISTYKNQALVLVAEEGATAHEIKTFAKKITDRVKEKTDIDVEWEVSMMQ
jgi:UDP-N-acetylmuramate dehydrogenase